MAERMAFTLDGNDNLSPVFRRIGESAERFHERINEAVEESGGDLRAFTRDASGQLRELDRTLLGAGRSATTLGNNAGDATADVRTLGDAAADASAQVERLTRDANGRLRGTGGRFVSAGEAAQRFGIDVGAAVPNVTRLGNAAGDAAVQVGGKSGGLGGALGAVAAIAGLSALPALGALVPALAGAGLAAVTMKLGFSGVAGAMEAAGKGEEEYAAALKALPAPAREFTKQLVSTKKEFEGLSGEIQKAMLPGFTQALKESSPLIKIVGASATEMGKGFGDAAAGVGRLMKDSGFQRDFTTVLGLGNVFVKDLTRGLGGLTRGFIDFGAKSEPTLRSLSGGLSDLLGKGLPGMFQGLERGIGGSSKFLDGFFSMLNNLLPALGRFSGEVARTFGPFLGEQMTLFGRVASRALDALGYGVRLLKPVFDDLTFGLKAAWAMAEHFGSAFKMAGKAVVDALAPAGASIEGVKGPLQRLHDSVQANRLGLMEFARIGAGVMLTIAEGVIRYLPDVIAGFRYLSIGALSSLDVIISGLAMTIGKIPGFGEQFQKANTDFDKFKDGFIGGLQTAEDKTRSFAASVLPRLSENRLKMDISSYESQIGVAKKQLASVPPEGKSKLTAHIAELERKAAQARAELASIKDRAVTVSLTYVTRGSMNNTTMRHEGLMKAEGGIIRGPGTSTSDSIPAMLSDGEYVIRAAAVDRIGQGALDALNSGRGLPAMAAASAPAAMPAARAASPTVINNITVNGAMDPLAVARQIQTLLLTLKRSQGGPDLGFGV
ncbi:hypothetical protein [Streptomyces erythrochromogenes]|uniref:hypothetical protein n=1 Tax=Streptomyces erythrochromogenes TaxID=285574 RepID=UPI0022512F0D|nr:hypothetical protein [Streptomyces erythrochromogenes]MCX5586039.1 hypothetical protein [Streptomyces erythrochromogenes]